MQVYVATEDASGIQTVLATFRPPEEVSNSASTLGSWQSITLEDDDGDGIWTGLIPSADINTTRIIPFFVQSVDTAGNVQLSGNKGIFFSGPELEYIYLPLVLRD